MPWFCLIFLFRSRNVYLIDLTRSSRPDWNNHQPNHWNILVCAKIILRFDAQLQSLVKEILYWLILKCWNLFVENIQRIIFDSLTLSSTNMKILGLILFWLSDFVSKTAQIWLNPKALKVLSCTTHSPWPSSPSPTSWPQRWVWGQTQDSPVLLITQASGVTKAQQQSPAETYLRGFLLGFVRIYLRRLDSDQSDW